MIHGRNTEPERRGDVHLTRRALSVSLRECATVCVELQVNIMIYDVRRLSLARLHVSTTLIE